MGSSKESVDFTAQMKELESIATWFESDSLDLDQALGKFERGMELAVAMKAHLGQIENRVEKLKQKFDLPVSNPSQQDPELETGPAE